jgi:hypothetical protein
VTPSKTPNTTSPAHGDIVVARDAAKKKVYSLSVVPGPPQMLCPSYEEAVSRASAWAAANKVATWLTQDGQMFTPLAADGSGAERLKKPAMA